MPKQLSPLVLRNGLNAVHNEDTVTIFEIHADGTRVNKLELSYRELGMLYRKVKSKVMEQDRIRKNPVF